MNKKLVLYILILFFTQLLFSQVNVTFRVNMNNATGFNPAIHKVYLSGASEGGTNGFGTLPVWPMPGNEPGFLMTGPHEQGYYSLTISGVSPGVYAYKYFLVKNDQPTWALGEWGGNPNRLGTVGTEDITFTNIWAQLSDDLDIKIFINEIMASNSITISDEDGDYEDWIELYNAGSSTANLAGYGLSDKEEELSQWVFPEVYLYPSQYLIVWASGKDRSEGNSPLHTNFRISAGGEPVILTDPDTLVIDLIPEVVHRTDISYGRLPDAGSEFRYMTSATPGWANTGPGYGRLLQPLTFSQPDGFYSSPFNLSISSPDEGVTIRYTLDGSEPTVGSALYQDPLHIAGRIGQPNTISMIPTNNNPDPGPPYFEGWQVPVGEVYKTTVVRAKAFHSDAPETPAFTYSYLVDNLAQNRYTLPVFFLNTDAAHLFDNETGFYVHGNDPNNPNFFQDGWERPASLTFFEKNGLFAFKEDVGIRLNGNTTRSRPRKSFRIMAKGQYGNSWINYQLFPDKETDIYKRFILRNSGNDWDFTVFRDGLFQYLAKNMHVETQYYRPSIVFINGEYWGIHNIRDKYDHRYIFAKYGIEESEMTILGDNSVYKWGDYAGKNHYDNLVTFIQNNNLQQTANYTYVTDRMDIESFIDFQLIHIFVKNTDWPGNNALYWRYRRDDYAPAEGVRDGRWRWMILDTDFGFDLPFFYVAGLDKGAAHNTLAFATEPNGPNWPNPQWSTLMLRKLLNNTGFRDKFITRYADLLNTTFSANHLIHVIDSIGNLLAPEMEEHINRWRRPVTVEEWNHNVQVLRDFATQRPDYQFDHLKQKFGLSNPVNLTLNLSHDTHGYIRTNTVDIKPSTMGVPATPYPWTGQYFPGIPLELEAHPMPGYMFSHWSGASSASTSKITLILTGNTQLTAHFVKVPVPDLIHFWFFGNNLANDTPLERIDATYSIVPQATIGFHSALSGYPFDNTHPHWRKASMERRNSPTDINYLPEGNNNNAFADANMRAIQIKQPFVGNGGENTLYIQSPTTGFKDIKLQFAAKDEGAASGLEIDYSIPQTPQWVNTGLSTTSLPLSMDYQLYEVDFTDIAEASDNNEFAVRIRFQGTDMTSDAGNRVTFNNFSITGKNLLNNVITSGTFNHLLTVFPNPASDFLTLQGNQQWVRIDVVDITGRVVITGKENPVDVSALKQGVYLIRATTAIGNLYTARFVKRH
jgi:hypothetical protein